MIVRDSQEAAPQEADPALAAAAAEEAAAHLSAVETVSEEESAPLPELPADASDAHVGRVAAALVFASEKPLTLARLAALLRQPPAKVRDALEAVSARLRSVEAPFSLTEIAGAYRFLTDPELGRFVAGLRGEAKKERLSGAALETLAIIAYRQPITRAEIEVLRGVQAGPILRALLERRLVRITGRASVPGRPLQYGTTREFLDRFQLGSLKDLPTVEELSKP